MSNKGYISTIITIMLALLLLSAVSLYYKSYKLAAEANPIKMRTDELHYFVESAKKDMGRAQVISSGRATIYSIDYAITPPGNPLSNYSFNCTDHCGVECSEFPQPTNGTEAALVELILCGTRFGQTVTEMENHTLHVWLDKVNKSGDSSGFYTNVSINAMDIYPFDSFRFLEALTLGFDISDKGGMCKYQSSGVRVYSLISLTGLEDPMYPLSTSNRIRRYFSESNRTGAIELLATGRNGKGAGGGVVFDVSAGGPGDQSSNITHYNSTYPHLVNYTVFVIDVNTFITDLSEGARKVLNLSGGVIDYDNENLDGQDFPYVSGCSPPNFSNTSHIALRNTAIEHKILYLLINDDMKNKLYHESDNGPCFFDRLDGHLNLSEKYTNQSKEIMEHLRMDPTTKIGLESFVNVSNFARYMLYDHGVLPPFANQSSVDYLYFQNISGNRVYGTPEWFRLDDEHCVKYDLVDFCHA